jgi:hypothetical protein
MRAPPACARCCGDSNRAFDAVQGRVVALVRLEAHRGELRSVPCPAIKCRFTAQPSIGEALRCASSVGARGPIGREPRHVTVRETASMLTHPCR